MSVACDIGDAVYAIKNTTQDTVYAYGEGVYVGDLPMNDLECPPEERERLIRIIEEDDAVPLDEHPLIEVVVDVVKNQNLDISADVIEELKADIQRERDQPLEDKVQNLWHASQLNPCIYLDSGDIVWGIQCWWGPKAGVDKHIAGRRVEIVPVPDGNGRWRD